MPIFLHSDFVEDYSNETKENPNSSSSNAVDYLVNAKGELMEKEVKQRLALKERIDIISELKTSYINDLEKQRQNMKSNNLRNNVCENEELPIKKCLMDYKNTSSDKQFEHLISCYRFVEKYESCIKKISC